MLRPLLLTLFALLPLLARPADAGPLDGKSYIIELQSGSYDSGLAQYLVPPLMRGLRGSGMRSQGGPGADVVVNVVTGSDVGQWVGKGENRVWLYTISALVGISPESYAIPYEGTPQYGVRASLMTPNPDREDEMACLITLATRTAVANYRPRGILTADGSACARR